MKIAPISIITDRDIVNILSSQKIFPKTKHNICKWHLLNNFLKIFKDTLDLL